MKKPMPMIAGIALALAVPAAFAQSGSAPPMSEQQQVQRTQQELQNRANEHATAPVSFEQLDLKKAGYLTKDDAKSDLWLSRNFRQCDTDQNDQVSRAEYKACTGKHKASDPDKMDKQ